MIRNLYHFSCICILLYINYKLYCLVCFIDFFFILQPLSLPNNHRSHIFMYVMYTYTPFHIFKIESEESKFENVTFYHAEVYFPYDNIYLDEPF